MPVLALIRFEIRDQHSMILSVSASEHHDSAFSYSGYNYTRPGTAQLLPCVHVCYIEGVYKSAFHSVSMLRLISAKALGVCHSTLEPLSTFSTLFYYNPQIFEAYHNVYVEMGARSWSKSGGTVGNTFLDST